MKGKLFLVATPIGNYEDITLRALNILKSSDIIVCEEYKEARRLLANYDINKELIPLNEHTEIETSSEIIQLLNDGKNIALISDCGTPLFSDPGHYLVSLCVSSKIDVIPIPGANSLLPALTTSGFNIEKFYYYGWLSPKKNDRQIELKRLKNFKEIIVLLDTPYRLQKLLSDVRQVFGNNTPASLAYELTMENEKIFRGTIAEIFTIASQRNLKGEFVLIVDNTGLKKSN